MRQLKVIPSIFVTILVLCFIFPDIVSASTDSKEFVEQGVSKMKERKFKKALKKFEAAEKTDPQDAEALFFQGAALNRLGRHKEALEKLEKAKVNGSEHPDLAFESGWSLMSKNRFEEAAKDLEEYERAHPGRGQTSEFLGRAYLGLGKHEKAEAKLQEALKRDPALKPTVTLYLVALEEDRRNSKQAAEYFQTIMLESRDSPIGRTLINQVAFMVAKEERPWRVALSTSGGYNSNVIALGDSSLLPADISSKDSAFFRFTLGGSYGWYLTPWDTLTTGYGFLANFYDEISDNDILDHYGYAQYSHAFNPDQISYFRVSDEFTELGGNKFRNKVTLRPSYSHRFNDRVLVESFYVLGLSDFYFDTADVQDRDSVNHALGLDGYFRIPKTKLVTRLGYYHLWNLANGGDFDYDSDAILLSLSHPLPWAIEGEFFYTHLFDGYDNPNSLAGGGFAFSRDDEVDIVTVQVSRYITTWLRAYARYDYTQNDSNIEFYNFDQHVGTAGLVAEY